MRPQTRSLRRSTTCRMYGLFMLFQFLLSWSAIFASHDHDRITFFNVGQGHATLVRPAGSCNPLLIDAGTRLGASNPPDHAQGSLWRGQKATELATKISRPIIDAWKTSDVARQDWGLNVIITHADDDHNSLLPGILDNLRKENAQATFRILLGGKAEHYKKEKKEAAGGKADEDEEPASRAGSAGAKPRPKGKRASKEKSTWIESLKLKAQDVLFYSINRLEEAKLKRGDDENCHLYDCTSPFEPLQDSGWFSSMFLPWGQNDDPNSWSIVTRIQLNDPNKTSALIMGDAGWRIQESLVKCEKDHPEFVLLADVLLYPHHGGAQRKGTERKEQDDPLQDHALRQDFRAESNPKLVIFGAGVTDNCHPQAAAVACLLADLPISPVPRSYDNLAPYHTILYANDGTNAVENALTHRRRPIVPTQGTGSWKHAWVDMPIYTLWTCGSLEFGAQGLIPSFLDTKDRLDIIPGLMPYLPTLHPYERFPPLGQPIMSMMEKRQLDILHESAKASTLPLQNLCQEIMQKALRFGVEHIGISCYEGRMDPTWKWLRMFVEAHGDIPDTAQRLSSHVFRDAFFLKGRLCDRALFLCMGTPETLNVRRLRYNEIHPLISDAFTADAMDAEKIASIVQKLIVRPRTPEARLEEKNTLAEALQYCLGSRIADAPFDDLIKRTSEIFETSTPGISDFDFEKNWLLLQAIVCNSTNRSREDGRNVVHIGRHIYDSCLQLHPTITPVRAFYLLHGQVIDDFLPENEDENLDLDSIRIICDTVNIFAQKCAEHHHALDHCGAWRKGWPWEEEWHCIAGQHLRAEEPQQRQHLQQFIKWLPDLPENWGYGSNLLCDLKNEEIDFTPVNMQDCYNPPVPKDQDWPPSPIGHRDFRSYLQHLKGQERGGPEDRPRA